MRRHFEDQIAECNSRLLHMGAVAQGMVAKSMQCLLERNAGGHEEVFRQEDKVNHLHIEIDERVISALALQHPVAADLRLLIMASKIAGELERVGDQAVNICESATSLLQHPPLKISTNVQSMADVAREMLRESLEAFHRRDAQLAQRVLSADDKVDAFKDEISLELGKHMMSDPNAVPSALPLILISRSLERIADHATNIAEEVIYATQGRDVRHHQEEKRREEAGEDESAP
ncbi:MAG: phosphate signaling complex protein PhoU [Acidobacteriia bacterium]|nr:phosphate signaling complex protein PhoU [Terriglobia bacterium]